MKKFLEKQAVFTATLRVLAAFSRRKSLNGLTRWATTASAKLNLRLNRPAPAQSVGELARTWQSLMPPDGQEYFRIAEVTGDTAYTEIHLACPLRGTGDTAACHRLMNYDRQLMRATGGELIVLESQSNSGKGFCRLAIRRKGQDTSDLRPAHQVDAAGHKD